MVSHHREFEEILDLLTPVAHQVMAEAGIEVECPFGAMIDTPRAAFTAGQIARQVKFLSFGAGILTGMTFGIDHDDAERGFLRHYLAHGILPANPFEILDEDGVGTLIRMAVRQGRETQPGLEIGVCGPQASDPSSIAFSCRAGLDHVSCSPARVPVARLAAAHAALGHY